MSISVPRSLLQHLPLWEWCDATGVFVAYNDENRVKLEAAFLEGQPKLVELRSGDISVAADLSTMTQRVLKRQQDHTDHGESRRVRRRDKDAVGDPTWTPQVEDVDFLHAPAGHTDADLAVRMVLGSSDGHLDPHEFAVVDVQRVQNRSLKWRYEMERKDM
eukprot:CAMPEP_0177284024 /NCGR_PEP_ID=MMETSP0367-20130122/72299_1 /TAXON_ID=447022 ORGANISM="Scrippsiella hangoei-like, Strain SHHI-4" /NCGR_SAMPLE_ID=MMETSP0367 /ASSEMBLY_ACC=CAM_ASM_000362 /LENGTH=160 /DNA_ID=CAMNT_0018741037 /DNA_START=32 /DNA_END=511 /DNA_ORIENTATION=-